MDSFFIFLTDINLTHDYTPGGGPVVRTPTGLVSTGGREIFHYSMNVQPLELDPYETYQLTIANNPPNENWAWGVSTTAQGSHGTIEYGRYIGGSGDLAFRLFGPVVPEPGTATLVCLALAGLAIRFRK